MQLSCGIVWCSLGKTPGEQAAMQILQIRSAGLQAAYCCC